MSGHNGTLENEYKKMLVGGTARSGPLPRHSQTGGFGALIPMLLRGVIGGLTSAVMTPKRGRGDGGGPRKRTKTWHVERNPYDEVVY